MANCSVIDLGSLPPNASATEVLNAFANTNMLPIDSVSNELGDLVDASNNFAEKLEKLEYSVVDLQLKVYILEGRISREEANRLLKMWKSEDPDNRYLAEEIINKFEDNEYSI
jgi:hypothetical protein